LLEIVNGILDISKIDSGKLEVTKSTYILNKLINEVIVVANKRKDEKPIEIKANVNKDLPQVLSGDAIKLKTILLAIVSNAIKYSKEGKINIDVDGYVKEDKIRLIINIEDSGKGIRKEVLNNLFSKYEAGTNDGSIEGSGLGVALTKKLVELMGGKIHVKSGEGVGTSFIIGIDQDIIAKTSNEVEGIYSEELEIYDLSGKKILVVDDNGVNLKVAKRLLKEYKIEVDLAESGQECIDKVKTGKYDLIMMDDFMPVMDGPTTLANLKQTEGFNIPVIALTANNESDSKAKYVGLGFNNYLAKPIAKEELNKELKEFLVQ
jgi:CheY-like chemotaxis protein/anti-sigma regulatory factor (Ser/Thr protein kinase)